MKIWYSKLHEVICFENFNTDKNYNLVVNGSDREILILFFDSKKLVLES
jgi:hypothetical protein